MLGAIVAKLVKKNRIHPESLLSEYKKALDLHIKKRVMNSFPDNIEFKPWQIYILQEVEILTERKVIWVFPNVGNKVGPNEGLKSEVEYRRPK